MPRRITPEERIEAWTRFAAAALNGFLANPEYKDMTCDQTIDYAKDCADGMLDKWGDEFRAWLDIEEEEAGALKENG